MFLRTIYYQHLKNALPMPLVNQSCASFLGDKGLKNEKEMITVYTCLEVFSVITASVLLCMILWQV